MKIMHDTLSRRFNDPASLTNYEMKLLDMKKSGMTHKQIAQTCKASENTISNKFTVINQKIKLKRLESEL